MMKWFIISIIVQIICYIMLPKQLPGYFVVPKSGSHNLAIHTTCILDGSCSNINYSMDYFTKHTGLSPTGANLRFIKTKLSTVYNMVVYMVLTVGFLSSVAVAYYLAKIIDKSPYWKSVVVALSSY